VTTPADSVPVLIGAGQAAEQVPEDLAAASSYADLAERAVRRALQDAQAEDIVAAIDAVAAVRTFEDSLPGSQRAFGGPDNLPGAVAARIGAQPSESIYGPIGGQSPQRLVNEFAGRCHRGSCGLVLLFGVEVIANVRAARRAGIELDWSEAVEAGCEDRGVDGLREMVPPEAVRHGLTTAMHFYGLMETARRLDLGLGTPAYQREMGAAFAPFSRIAAGNPLARFPRAFSIDELITPDRSNPMLASPYTLNLVARDGVNQAAALLLTTAGRARALGVPEERWVYLHGYADTDEIPLLRRPSLGRSLAMDLALRGALEAAGRETGDIGHFDLYSCFPIVVLEARRALGLDPADPRPLTQTGGLPYFGGPGNNYTMHGIAALLDSLRADRGSFGLAQGNGGLMSKHSVGIYSTMAPAAWRPCDSGSLQEQVRGQQRVEVDAQPTGRGRVETWVVDYRKGEPAAVVVVGRQEDGHGRFVARNAPGADDDLNAFVEGDPAGQPLQVTSTPEGNVFTLAP
jgi:acetyl-CoA C-acetyltransferase